MALRDEGRSATVQQTINVDTKAPRVRGLRRLPVQRPAGAMGNVISQGDRDVQIYIKGVSPRYATQFRVFRTDDGKPREVGAASSSRAARTARSGTA